MASNLLERFGRHIAGNRSYNAALERNQNAGIKAQEVTQADYDMAASHLTPQEARRLGGRWAVGIAAGVAAVTAFVYGLAQHEEGTTCGTFEQYESCAPYQQGPSPAEAPATVTPAPASR